jgi:organic radical activating enzyme
MVLGFMAAMMALAIGWIWQGSSLSVIWRRDRALAYRQNTSMDTTARVGIALLHPDGQAGSVVGNVSLSDSFVSSASNSTSSATVNWGSHSLRYPLCSSFTNYENLFGNGEAHSNQPKDHLASGNKYGNVPLAGYDSELVLQSGDGIPLTPGQLLVCQQGMGGSDHVAVYQQTFPFAAYAPKGAVKLDSCWAWQNPTMDQSEKEPRLTDPYPYASGLPVLVRAGGKIQIDGDFPCGSATSSSGPILLPENSTAMGFSGIQPDDSYCQNLTTQVQNAMTALSQGNMDKNQWIKGKGLSVAGFRDLIKSGDWQAFLTVQQACGFPIPLFPTMAFDEPFVEIVMIHHPFPADFSTGGNPADAEEMKKLVERLKEINNRIAELTTTLIPQMQKAIKDDDAEIQKDKDELGRAKDKDKPGIQERIDKEIKERGEDEAKLKAFVQELSKLKQEVKDTQAQLQEIQARTNSGQEGDIPQSAWADATAGKGSTWAYFRLGKQVVKGLWDLIKGEGSKAFDDIVPPTRLVHFGAMNPEWDYEDPGYTMKSTVNVPAGKTLKLGGGAGSQSRKVHIKGDLWIQRGATCFVDGDLEISKPPLQRRSRTGRHRQQRPRWKRQPFLSLGPGDS